MSAQIASLRSVCIPAQEYVSGSLVDCQFSGNTASAIGGGLAQVRSHRSHSVIAHMHPYPGSEALLLRNRVNRVAEMCRQEPVGLDV